MVCEDVGVPPLWACRTLGVLGSEACRESVLQSSFPAAGLKGGPAGHKASPVRLALSTPLEPLPLLPLQALKGSASESF